MTSFNIKKRKTESKAGSLISAVREGKLQMVESLVNSLGLSYAKEWSDGYELLRDALEYRHREVAKLLLLKGSKVNSNFKYFITPTPLHYAAIYADLEIVEMLLDRNAKVDDVDMCGKTPLHCAVEKNNIGVVKLLLKHKACVKASDKDGLTPLHYAAQILWPEVTELLLKYNPDVNIKAGCGTQLHISFEKEKKLTLLDNETADNSDTSTGYTPLHLASLKGHTETARLLLINGADVNAVARGNLSPLYIATKVRHKNTVELLLKHGADVNAYNEDGKTALCYAVEEEYPDIIDEILKFSPDSTNESNRSSFYSAIKKNDEGYKKIVESLIKFGFSVSPKDINDWELLHFAVSCGYLTIVEDLLRYGADVNIKSMFNGCQLLHTATVYLQEEMVKLLINHGAHVNAKDEYNKTPIFYAIQNLHFKIIKLLLANGAKIGVNNTEDNIDLLKIAVNKESIDIIELLLEYIPAINFQRLIYNQTFIGASPDFLLRSSRSILHTTVFDRDVRPLHISAQRGSELTTLMLLRKGALVNAQREDGTTALHIAAGKGHIKVVEMLIEYGAAVNSRAGHDRQTPLHCAVRRNHLEVVKTLIQFGADVDSTDARGETAMDILSDRCSYERNLELSELLLRHIVRLNLLANDENLSLTRKKLERHLKSYQKRYYIRCEKEIKQMKNEMVYDTNVSFYDIFTKSVEELAIYARNESIVEVFESTKYYAEMFPIFAEILEDQFRKGQERQCLLKSSRNSLNSLFGHKLPDVLIDKVFCYLTNLDLRNLMIAWPFISGDESLHSL